MTPRRTLSHPCDTHADKLMAARAVALFVWDGCARHSFRGCTPIGHVLGTFLDDSRTHTGMRICCARRSQAPTPSAGPRARPPSSTALRAGSIGIYGLRHARTCATRVAELALSAAWSHGARSHPRPSGAPATLWPALEGLFASPCSPTDSFWCAGRRSRSRSYNTWVKILRKT